MKKLPVSGIDILSVCSFAFALTLTAQSTQVVDSYTPKQLEAMKHPGTNSFHDLKKYGNHYTMLAYRETTGSSEIHEHEVDIFFVQEGDATILTGGRMIGGHTTKPGELRGTSIEGGTRQPMRTGDVIHIPAGVPHQLLIAPGKPITYFVVKVTGQ
jgi:mannose-6-phosphate isomerase-like protein (cupin superfamily)